MQFFPLFARKANRADEGRVRERADHPTVLASGDALRDAVQAVFTFVFLGGAKCVGNFLERHEPHRVKARRIGSIENPERDRGITGSGFLVHRAGREFSRRSIFSGRALSKTTPWARCSR